MPIDVSPFEIDELRAARALLPAGDWTTHDATVRVGGHPVAASGSAEAAAYLATAGDLAPRLADGLRDLAATTLRLFMERLSLKYTEEPWALGLPEALWRAVLHGPRRLEEEEVDELDRLAELAGGWYAAPDEFVPLPEWRARYARTHGAEAGE